MIVAGVVVMGTCACGALADEPRDGAQGGAPIAPKAADGGAAEFVAWAAEQKKAIETIAGATFERDVPVKIVSTDELAQMIAKTFEGNLAGAKRANGAPMSEIEIRVRATAAAFKVATRTFGMYRYEDGVVYVLPENAKKYAKKHGWSEETAARTPRLAIAHEMVHALQDQKASLGERMKKVSGEEQMALRAVVEGQAVWVTDQLAKQLDWGAANAVMWGVVTGAHTDDTPGPGAKDTAEVEQRVSPSSETYSLGKAWAEYHAGWTGEGPKGTVRVWLTVVNPPTTMAQLKEPAKFEVKAKEMTPPAGGGGGGAAGSPPPPSKP
jgi:hypothetical protein